MQTIWNENSILLHGRAERSPVVSHTSHGEVYFTFPLVVLRLSGAEDRINVVLPAALTQRTLIQAEDELTVRGEVRSFNNKSGQGSRLVITVYAREVVKEAGEDENRLHLTGTLCKPSIHRQTPLGRDICDMMLAVNRRYGRTDYLPCISWGVLAQRCGQLSVGTRIKLDGRLQSRVYVKKLGESAQERTAFEISVMEMEVEDATSQEGAVFQGEPAEESSVGECAEGYI